jgi:excisionase family DNA binding protein
MASYLSIGQAAKLLGVSVDTLRRKEESGELIPERSEGGHRRYSSLQIDGFRKKHIDEAITLYAHCVKVKDAQRSFEKLCSKFDPDEVVTFVFHQHSGYPGTSIHVEGQNKYSCEAIPMTHEAFSNKCDPHYNWHREP